MHFLVNNFMARIGKRIESVSQRTMEQLLAYRWPGNIRELENVLERAVILETDSILEIEPGILSATGAVSPTKERPSLETVERDHISAVLDETNWVDRRPRGRGQDPGTASQHPSEPLEKARNRTRLPPPAVAATTGGGAACSHRVRYAPFAHQSESCKSCRPRQIRQERASRRPIGTRVALSRSTARGEASDAADHANGWR